MRAGDLRRRIAVQKRAATLDAWGQQSSTWTDVLSNCPAAIESLTGMEKLHAMQIMAEITHKVTVRYNAVFADPAVVDSWRLVYNGRIMNVHAIMNVDERNRTVEILCSEGLNDGR